MEARRLGAAVFPIVLLALPAAAHEDPPGCNQIGAAIIVQTFRADGTTAIVGSVTDCEAIVYRARLQKANPLDDTICAFSGGTFTLTTPDGVPHLISGDVPCLGGDNVVCHDSIIGTVPYTATPADVTPGGFLVATGSYSGGVAHDNTPDTPGVAASTPKSLPAVACSATTTTPASSTTTTTIPLPKSACTATKLTTASKLGMALVKCDAKAVKAGAGILASCVTKAVDKFTTKWTSLDAKSDCLTTGDLPAVQTLAESFRTGLASMLVPGITP